MMESNITKTVSSPDKNTLKDEYDSFSDVRHLIVNDLKVQIEKVLVHLPSNPVVSGRIKIFESYFSKYLRLLKAGNNNPVINDLMGIRIICPFIEDLSSTENLLKSHFDIVDTEKKGHYTFKEFGYESTHLLVKIPKETIEEHGDPGTNIAEIQIRTILQDAWAEVEHELVYKAEFSPFDEPMRRKLAAVNASLSLADIIFQEIRTYQRKFSKELGKRRESFFKKIEESTDGLFFTEDQLKDSSDAIADSVNEILFTDFDNVSIDDLLVNALSAHNQSKFGEAISQYTRILDLDPDDEICSIIYKHRGMANFACSRYNEAIEDFSKALEYDEKSYKAAYYRGIVYSVLKDYMQAIEDYSLSLALNPYQSFCLFRRGQAYFHIGDFMEALSDCENSIALDPQNKSALNFREVLRTKLRM